MPRKKANPPTAFVHDHFDGSAHCIECGGACKLTGCELAFTSAVRFCLEREARHPETLCGMPETLFKDALGTDRMQALRKRAKETM